MQMPGPMMNATIFIVPIAIIMIVMVLLRFFRAGKRIVEGFRMEAPRLAIPERQRGQMRSDGSEIRTVRLPNKCSNCGALFGENIRRFCELCGFEINLQVKKESEPIKGYSSQKPSRRRHCC